MRNSLFAPEKIIGSQKGSKESALNFISGGSPIGSSMLSGAKNNIVGFNRAKISPKKNNLGSLISTLTTNIFNNINSGSNIFGDKKEKSEKGFKPFGGLFDKVKEAIGFISFFGSKKNLDKIKENIDNLKTTFIETFDVAKALRKAILKIVEQLSGFSGGGGGGGIIGAIMSALGGLVGGLIPGMGGKRPPNVAGPAMKQEGNLLSKMPKGGGIGKLLLGGAAAVGAGSVVSGLSQPGDEDVQPGDTAPEVPGNVLDKFNSILDRFDKVLDGLRGGKGKKGSDSGAKSSGSSSSPGSSPSLSPGSTGPAISSAPGDEKLAAFVASMEASSPENAADAMQVMLNRSATSGKGLSDVLSRYDQFSPISAAIFGKSADKVAEAKYGPIAAKLPGKNHQEKFKYLQQVAAEPDGLNKLQQLFGGGNAGVAATVLNDPKYLNASRQNVKGALNFYGGNKTNASDIQVRPGGNNFYNFTGKVGTLGSQPTGTTTVQPSQEQLRKPPAAKASGAEAPQVSLVNVGSGTPQASPSRPSSTTTPPSPTGGNGPTAPFLPSYNSDNFLTLYSRMVYNIVG